jgi:hypothetical protein
METLISRWALANPKKALLVAGVATGSFIMVPFIGMDLFLTTLGPTTIEQIEDMTLPGDSWSDVAVKPGVIPAKVLQSLEKAAMAERVPLQLLAGEAEDESDFKANATNYAPGTHAMGMFQFEPQTWSGWNNPYASVTTYDTNPSRIKQYGGMGVDANGDGTADPFDPYDAAMAAATYLRQLYNQYGHHWSLASYWYGSETQSYVDKVFRYTESFFADSPPIPDGSGFWFLGGTESKVVTSNGNTLTLSAPAWTTIIAPESGTLSIQYGNSGDTLTLDTNDGTFKFSGSIVAWANSGSVQAGAVIGVTTGNINVSGNVSSFPVPNFKSNKFNSIMAEALKYQGYPYVYGGASPKTSFDCSGLTQWVYGRVGIHLPRTAQEQWDATQHIPESEARPGDLVFFSGTYDDGGDVVTHVGIYVGGGVMYDADDSGIGYHSLSGYWTQHLYGFGRVQGMN